MTNAPSHAVPDAAPRPAALDRIAEDRIVRVDVRDDLRNGREPFGTIMEAREKVPEGGALVVRAIFEPAPLYRVMARHGFTHWTERLADDDWRVWFHPPETADAAADDASGSGAAAAVGSGTDGSGDGAVVLDVRGLEPPEPMVRTLEALETLPAGATLVQINVRVPQFLLPRLEERGWSWEIREQEEDLVRVFIRRAGEGADEAPADPTPERVLDVRVIPPREKHPAIFQTFDALRAGESFVLVNDHDPKPLRYQFQHERTDLFAWEYLEQGPAVWRVRISRVEAS